MESRFEIREGGSVFCLASRKGKELLYDFTKILVYLDAKGKILFGKNFRIYEEDQSLLYLLSNYFIKDEEKCKKMGLDIQKGLLISGPVGCGKTSIMKLLPHIVPFERKYEMIPTRNVSFSFNHIGYKAIEDYGNSGIFCFDDLGIEPLGRFFGQDCNVMGEVLLSRYEIFLKHKIRTYGTTNLDSEQIEERYGARVRSRMRGMFNLIYFDEKTQDKRK
ncbi:MAG: ATPase [Christiangramia sp.]|nr:ATPase [Christiangramia sp.]